MPVIKILIADSLLYIYFLVRDKIWHIIIIYFNSVSHARHPW